MSFLSQLSSSLLSIHLFCLEMVTKSQPIAISSKYLSIICACDFLKISEVLAECLRKLSLCAAKSIFLTTILLRKQNVEKHCKIDFIFLALPLILKVCFFLHHHSLHNLQNLTLLVLPEICSKVLGEGTIRKLLR